MTSTSPIIHLTGSGSKEAAEILSLSVHTVRARWPLKAPKAKETAGRAGRTDMELALNRVAALPSSWSPTQITEHQITQTRGVTAREMKAGTGLALAHRLPSNPQPGKKRNHPQDSRELEPIGTTI